MNRKKYTSNYFNRYVAQTVSQVFILVLLYMYVSPGNSKKIKALKEISNILMNNKEAVQEIQKWKNYAYATKHLKVYYYELPEHFNWYWVKNSHENPSKMSDPYCDENFYSAENRIAKFFETSSVRTLDGEEADFFYVPIFTTCYLQSNHPTNVTKTGLFFEKGMRFIIERYPFWNRSDGRDHIFMFAQGNGAVLSGDWEKYKLATFLVHNGDYDKDHYSPFKDIVVPPDISHYLTPVWLDKRRKKTKKKYIAMFGGHVLNNSAKDENGHIYSGGVRQHISEKFSAEHGFKITGIRSPTYLKDMTDSQFCLAPEGWHKWSPRPVYAFLLGCIPLVISEKQNLFLENIFDYSKLSVRMKPKDLPFLPQLIRQFSLSEVRDKEDSIRDIWKCFWYGQDGLAAEAILLSLYRKLHDKQPFRQYA